MLPKIFFINTAKEFRDDMGQSELCDAMMCSTSLFNRLTNVASALASTSKVAKLEAFCGDVMELRAKFGGCVDCFVKDSRVLTNDHLDPATNHKKKSISRPGDWTDDLDAWVEEFLLCATRCHSCHNISTGLNNQNGRARKSDSELSEKQLKKRKSADKAGERTKEFREMLKMGDVTKNSLVASVNEALASNGKGQLGECVACGFKFDSPEKTPACTFDHLDKSKKLKLPSEILCSKATPETLARNFIAESKRAGFGVICSNCDHLGAYYKVKIYETYDAAKDCLFDEIEKVVGGI
ncbi:hypothetical protein TrST_g2230 [Triparma strigata]|uniref:Uncharacterized protein n=1 Tax=Triparma strigata TaxID=1606541 RepID=A0A9W7E8G7_9STRA|nr:hypothetical protein TrST_g2230 [Triparma strigata]